MKAGLQEINEIVGVWGSLVINNRGEVMESETPPGLNQAALSNIANHIVALLSSGERSLTGLKEIVIHFQNRRIFIQDLARAILVVICTPSIDLSLLRLSTNVVLVNWESDSRVQRTLDRNDVERI